MHSNFFFQSSKKKGSQDSEGDAVGRLEALKFFKFRVKFLLLPGVSLLLCVSHLVFVRVFLVLCYVFCY